MHDTGDPQPRRTGWPAHFLDGRSATSRTASVRLGGGGLDIETSDGMRLWWPYGRVRMTQGALGGEQVRLEKTDRSGEALTVADTGFLEALEALNPALGRQAGGNSYLILKLILLAAGAIGAVAAAYFWVLPAAAEAAASLIPVSWEERLGETVVDQIVPQASRCDDPARLGAIDQIVATLVPNSGTTGYRFRVTLANDPAVNAFAAPGGRIVVNRGLLAVTKNAEQLAGVLAHEIQHVLQRHATRALFRDSTLSIVASTLTGDAGAFGSALELAGTLGALRYRRSDEEDADRRAMDLLHGAQIDSRGLIEFLGVLSRSAGETPGGLSYLSTHPPTGDRIALLEELARRAPSPPRALLPDFPWSEMAKACRP